MPENTRRNACTPRQSPRRALENPQDTRQSRRRPCRHSAVCRTTGYPIRSSQGKRGRVPTLSPTYHPCHAVGMDLGWRRRTMRFLVKVSFPVEAGNAAAKKDGFKVIQTILEQQKPEAAYFIADGGRRTGILILNMSDPSELPRIAEPWFLALNASIEATPAMIPEDLQRAAPVIEQVVKTFG